MQALIERPTCRLPDGEHRRGLVADHDRPDLRTTAAAALDFIAHLDEPQLEQTGQARLGVGASQPTQAQPLPLDQASQQLAIELIQAEPDQPRFAFLVPPQEQTPLLGHANPSPRRRPFPLRQSRPQHLAEGCQIVARRPSAQLEHLWIERRLVLENGLDVPDLGWPARTGARPRNRSRDGFPGERPPGRPAQRARPVEGRGR